MAKKKEFLFGDQFTNYIKGNIPGARIVSGGREIQIKCRYCTDSIDPGHGHLYIKVPTAEDEPILFHCFKCQTSGILDSRALMEWGIYDPEIGLTADKINKLAAKNKKYVGYNREWYPFHNGILDAQLAQAKVDYINGRLGTNLSIPDCMKQKIVLNVKEAVDYNRFEYTRNPNILQQLNDNFVGFLSLDNNFVNMRRLCDEGRVYESIDKRYINYNIHAKQDNTEKMYIMPTTIDLTNPKKVEFHIAEGPFDILSIKYNLRKDTNGIFAAVTGSGYRGLVMHLISTFKIFYFDLHVYPDNDNFGSSKVVEDLNYIVKPYGATLYEHRNVREGEKDFGVDLSRIDERVYIHG